MAPRSLPLVFLVLTLAAGCGKVARDSAGSKATPASPTSQTGPSAEPRKAMLEIRAELRIDLADGVDASGLSGRLQALARDEGGWVELVSAASDEGNAPTHLVLRVPERALADVRALLTPATRPGTGLRETVTAKDVTDAIVDLEARLHAAQSEEARLLKLLDEKTGTLADVLAAERALADVRERIERLTAEQRQAKGRGDLATVDVWLMAPSVGATDLSGRLALAAKDGVKTVRDVSIGALLLALRTGPLLILLGALAFLGVRIARIVRRGRSAGPASPVG